MAADHVYQVAVAIIAQLKAGTAPWLKPWYPGERFLPYNPTTGNPYHGMNAVWLMSRAENHGFGDPRWMTYRQAQEAGAQVRQGEKGTAIQFWKWRGLESVRNENGNPRLDENGLPVREMVRYERPRVWSAVVFNAGQIDGLPPAPDWSPPAEWERHERAEAILAHSGATIRHARGDRACYHLSEDAITLPERVQFSSADRYYATALHELGHWTGHPSRLNREDLGYPFGSEAYAREELRAEIASLMLGEQLGIGHDPGQHMAYVASWIRVLENDPREIFRAAADADRITRHIRAFEHAHEQAGDQEQGMAPADPPGSDRIISTAVEIRTPTLIRKDHPAMTMNDDRTYLAVPYDEKEDAKALGAKWDGRAKAWYIPAGGALEAFAPWLPSRGSVHIAVDTDPREEFARALRESGLRMDGLPEMDGRLHRVPVEGDRGGERGGAYVGHLDGRPAGYIQNFRTGQRINWKAAGPAMSLDAQDRARLAAEAAQRRQERAADRERQYERTAQEVEAIWASATPVEAHPYLAGKEVASHGLRQDALGRLLVPVTDADGKLWSFQRIGPDGFKQFYEGGRVERGHHVIGDLAKPGPVVIAEGYATAATLHALTDGPAIVAFNAGNLVAVARTYRALYPDREIHIAGDNDHRRDVEGKPNVGREKAMEAAAAIGGLAVLPIFTENDQGSDWNDVARDQGADTARRQFAVAIAIAERERTVRDMAADRADDREHGRSVTRATDLGLALSAETGPER
jgi:antirestriction protein ArdC/phage/plasmid primase-like uncharacterized protein